MFLISVFRHLGHFESNVKIIATVHCVKGCFMLRTFAPYSSPGEPSNAIYCCWLTSESLVIYPVSKRLRQNLYPILIPKPMFMTSVFSVSQDIVSSIKACRKKQWQEELECLPRVYTSLHVSWDLLIHCHITPVDAQCCLNVWPRELRDILA